MKMKKQVILGILFSLIFVSLIYAGFELGDVSYDIVEEYAPGAEIRGWINISFDDEEVSKQFTDSFDNAITLKEALEKNPSYDYSCDTFRCLDKYEYSLNDQEKNVVLGINESQTFGIVLTDEIDSIDAASFVIESNAGATCSNQIQIDIGADSEFVFGNSEASSTVCEGTAQNYSCYEKENPTTLAIVTNTPYCQRVVLDEAPGFRVGAWVKRVSADDVDLLIRLFGTETKNIEGEEKTVTEYLKSCTLDIGLGEEGEFSCDIEYVVDEKKEYYLCLFANTDEEVYQTKRTTSPEHKCGFYGVPQTNNALTSTYHIFYQPLQFDVFSNLEISDSGFSGKIENFTDYLESVLIDRYGDTDCTEGCVIPVTITSQVDAQSIMLRDVQLEYDTNVGKSIANEWYDTTTQVATVESDFQKLYLDNWEFRVPTEYDDYTYNVFFDAEELTDDEITVGNVPIVNDIHPKTTALGYPTTFVVAFENATGKITQYSWEIDGNVQTTQTNYVEHAFQTLGTHNLSVTIEDAQQRSSTKTFAINVVTPESKIEQDIVVLKNKIENVGSELNSYTQFEKEKLEEILDLVNAQTVLENVEVNYEQAGTEPEYLAIVEELFSVDLPDTIIKSDQAQSILFFPKKEYIDLFEVEEISTKPYEVSRENEYKDALIAWMQSNWEVKVSYTTISSVRGNVLEELITFYELEFGKIGSAQNSYLFLQDTEQLAFEGSYGETFSGSFYTLVLNSDTTISFSTTEEFDFVDLGVFVSVPLEELSLVDVSPSEENSYWTFFTLALLFLIIIAFVVYAILFQWYKNKYEDHLFKNRNNLYNLLVYITHQKKKGAEDKEIVLKLKKAKWSGEQIDYAMKKYYGKNTGMFELPFLKLIFGKKKHENTFAKSSPDPSLRFGRKPF